MPEGRIARWLMELQNYIFEIQYIKGEKNHFADLISRSAPIQDVEKYVQGPIEAIELFKIGRENIRTQEEKEDKILQAHDASGHSGPSHL